MNIAVQSGNNFHGNGDGASSVMGFDPVSRRQQPINRAASGYSEITRRTRRFNLVGTPIDVAFGSVDILFKQDIKTLERMAANQATSVIVLERLAAHPSAAVRAAVSDNQNTPLFTIWALAKDADADVRYQLAENHNLPIALIRSLTKDENPYVACRAQQTFDRLTVS
jgi:hypothetical protein